MATRRRTSRGRGRSKSLYDKPELLPDALPEWAEPDPGRLQELRDKTGSGPPRDWLDCLTDADIERALFGFSSMGMSITIPTEEIDWNPTRQGTPEEIEAEVDEYGEDYYDTTIPLIVDLMWDGSFELNDGHHRFFILTEYMGDTEVDAYVQIPRGLAKEWARKLVRQAQRDVREVEDNPYPVDNTGEGIGSTPNNMNIDYLGMRVLMTPSKFHLLTLELPRDRARSADAIKRQMQSIERTGVTEPYVVGDRQIYGPAQGFASPSLYLGIPDGWSDGDFTEPAQVTGHEGRNRMYAAKELYGEEPVEVHIFPVYYRARHITPDWVRRMNEGLVSERHGGRGDGSEVETAGPFFTSLGAVQGNPGDIVGFPEAPPRVEILGRSYALSTTGVPMLGGTDFTEPQEGGAQVIDAGGNPWRYLWLLNEDDGEVAMFRWSDGDWKVSGSRADFVSTLRRLTDLRQLNTVDGQTFGAIEQWMAERYHEAAERLGEWVSELESDQQKQVNDLVMRYLRERVMPEAERMWAEIDAGVYPFDFDYNANIPKSREQQAKMHAMYTAIDRTGFQPYDSDLERFVLRELGLAGIDQLDDMQALQWAVGDAMDAAYRKVPGGS